MKILLTNDDGVFSEGIRLLALELQKKHDVYIVAPDSERSATAHAITVRSHIDLRQVELEGVVNPVYAISGTPADCVRIGLSTLYKDIDIVFAGINRGYNAGADIQYSGTVNACAEANIYRLPGVAVSTEFVNGSSDFKFASKFVLSIFEKYKDLVMDEIMVLNINVPKRLEEDIKGIKVCDLGDIVYDSFYNGEESSDEFIRYHLNDRNLKNVTGDVDQKLLNDGYITITPIKYSFKDDLLTKKFLAIN